MLIAINTDAHRIATLREHALRRGDRAPRRARAPSRSPTRGPGARSRRCASASGPEAGTLTAACAAGERRRSGGGGWMLGAPPRIRPGVRISLTGSKAELLLDVEAGRRRAPRSRSPPPRGGARRARTAARSPVAIAGTCGNRSPRPPASIANSADRPEPREGDPGRGLGGQLRRGLRRGERVRSASAARSAVPAERPSDAAISHQASARIASRSSPALLIAIAEIAASAGRLDRDQQHRAAQQVLVLHQASASSTVHEAVGPVDREVGARRTSPGASSEMTPTQTRASAGGPRRSSRRRPEKASRSVRSSPA